jgi:hypothetical protein
MIKTPPRSHTHSHRSPEPRSVQAASANVTVSQNLLLWSGWDAGVGSYDSVDFYTVVPQTLFMAHLTARGGFPPTQASWDLGLLDQTGHELTGNGYGRVNVNFTAGNWAETVAHTVQNMVAIIWSAATAAWQTAYNLGIYDHSSGQLLQSSPLASPVTVGSGNQLQFGPNALSLYVQI